MFASHLDTSSSSQSRIKILLYFYEKQKKSSWFSSNEDLMWEQWILSLTLTQAKTEKEEIQAKKKLESDLTAFLKEISFKCMERLDSIPPITSNEPFPFQVNLKFI